LKITLAQLSFHTGNFEGNTKKMLDALHLAKAEGADLIVFSELATCGYPARDFLEFTDFINECQKCVDTLASHCIDIAAIVGSPAINPVLEGKDLFNAAYFLANGKIEQVVKKTLLPNYDIFDEYRYFEPNHEFNIIEYKGEKIALTICEDLWNVDENPMYRLTPMEELIRFEPTVMINIAASPYSKTQIQTRQQVLSKNASKYQLPLFYVNHIGAQTHLVFDGGSCVIDKSGEIYDELAYFEEDQKTYIVQEKSIELSHQLNTSAGKRNKHSDIETALVLGIKQYFQKLGFGKAILGLSGGIDSALVTYLAVKALGAENVLPVLLPSQFSSEHSVQDSVDLCNNLSLKYEMIKIEEVYNGFMNNLQPFFEGTSFGLAEENLQSRTRGVLLMALANKHGYILLNTSNKSELAVGYGTLYGDMCGGLSVIGDLYKTEIFELCQFINRNGVVIPENILTKEPSAELRPNQKDSDSLPAYEVLDKILYYYIEDRLGPQQIIAKGFDPSLVRKTLRMVNMNEWKRWQAPPVIRLSKKAFGPGRRVPISGKYLG
jgi:NAD+ synthase (glutamine-hydrolysing)